MLLKDGLYNFVKNIYREIRRKRRLNSKFIFENRKKDYSKLCVIIAGYKPFLYDICFKRIIKYIPRDIDVCIVSSGKYDEKLSKIAKENDWSYISTRKNNVSIIQNITINEFKNAKYIYKLDEDIFVTEGYFETLLKTYENCEKTGEYNVGFVAPTIPINGFGNMSILKRFGKVEYYTQNFERPLYAAGAERKIESDPEVAKFMWGEGNYIPKLDDMNEIMKNDEFSYSACPIRFSIGAILFNREVWEDMKMFKVIRGTCMGIDEEHICTYCMKNSKAIIVSNNSVVGHLSFGSQNQIMKEYFLNNPEKFQII